MENFGWVLYIFDGCFISCSVMSNSLHPHGLQPARLLSMGFSRQEYWSEWPFPSPGGLLDSLDGCYIYLEVLYPSAHRKGLEMRTNPAAVSALMQADF